MEFWRFGISLSAVLVIIVAATSDRAEAIAIVAEGYESVTLSIGLPDLEHEVGAGDLQASFDFNITFLSIESVELRIVASATPGYGPNPMGIVLGLGEGGGMISSPGLDWFPSLLVGMSGVTAKPQDLIGGTGTLGADVAMRVATFDSSLWDLTSLFDGQGMIRVSPGSRLYFECCGSNGSSIDILSAELVVTGTILPELSDLNVVPEPETGLLLSVGLLGLVGLRRSSRRVAALAITP